MIYKKQDNKDTREITISEYLVSNNTSEFIGTIDSFCKSSLQTLIVNFEKTKIIDSAGLGVLLIARQKVTDCKKNIILKHPKKHVKKAFDTINFENLFNIEHE